MVFSKFFDDVKKESPLHNVTHETSALPKKRKNNSQSAKRGPRQPQNAHENLSRDESKRPKKKTRKRSRPPKNNGADGLKRQRSSPPSAEALALSATLKEMSSRKRLQDCLSVYRDPANDNIRDGHHGCIMVDCCARCGDIEQGEEVVEAMLKSGIHINVETKTALLKGYAHSGMIEKGARLFQEMCQSRAKRDRPNVRTLNTLLRGCLWTAASLSNELSPRPVGGVITSEEAWSTYRLSLEVDGSKRNCVNTFGSVLDSSSYEYSISMLCQALLCDAAVIRIDEMKQVLGMSRDDDICGGDQAAVESLAVCLLSLARSYVLVGRVREAADAAQRAVKASNEALALLGVTGSEETLNARQQPTAKKIISGGGKRAWRKQTGYSPVPMNTQQVARRTASNNRFRTHRLSEVCSESRHIFEACREDQLILAPRVVAFFLLTRLLYFSGGGTTDLSTTRASMQSGELSSSGTGTQLMNSLWHSFGLKAALELSDIRNQELTKCNILSEDDCRNIVKAVGLRSFSAVDDQGYIDFDPVFAPICNTSQVSRNAMFKQNCSGRKRPLCIELGSGFGDWIVGQAQRNPSKNYVAVEMRSDRVAQTFSKAMFCNGSAPLENLCCVGSEAGLFLRRRVRNRTVSTIFVNHPEPPTQTHGANGVDLHEIANGNDELAHMLNSETLLSAANCLEDSATARLVIVTDNRWYARLICVTLLKVMRSNKGLLRSAKVGGGLRQIEVFNHEGYEDQVVLYEGQPSVAIGYAVSSIEDTGTSYFDRLWRTGAGTHAENTKRFIIVMERSSNASISAVSRSKLKKNERKKQKRSAAKQKRRNERRLKKKRLAEK